MNQLETAFGDKMSKIIVANWKMNGSVAFINPFFQKLSHNPAHKIVFCPPFPYLNLVNPHLTPENYFLGAQDCHAIETGAFTGDTSVLMLKDLGCKYVIVGHSERRHGHLESNELVQQKSQTAIKNNLIPIICVGETLVDRQSGTHLEVVKQQLIASTPPSEEPIIIAYEPVWAIGTGLSATLNDIAQMHQMIATHCHGKHKILYGGSVTADNAAEIMSQAHVDGVLVGGASLKPEVFGKIMQG